MAKFGWCMTGHHEACRVTISTNPDPDSNLEVVVCSCECHNRDERLVLV